MCIEHCFGVWKMRFQCLQRCRTLHSARDRSCKIINACAVLHSMCVAYSTREPLHDAADGDAPMQEEEAEGDATEGTHEEGGDYAEDLDDAH